MDEKMVAMNNFVDAEVKLYEILNNEFTNLLETDFNVNKSRKARANLNIRIELTGSIEALCKYLDIITEE